MSPGHIYESHIHKTLAPPNLNKVKKLHNYSFGKEIREANNTKVKTKIHSPSPTDYKLTMVEIIKRKAPGVGFGKAMRQTIFPSEKVNKPNLDQIID